MKYVNAKVILPDSLVVEIQKYIEGGYLYIPCRLQSRRKGRKPSDYIRHRNEDICKKYKEGYKIKDLSEDFYLSIDSIKKIVYTK